MGNHEHDFKQALPANIWLDKEQLKSRLLEEEIVEIDDFFTNVATKELPVQAKTESKKLPIIPEEELAPQKQSEAVAPLKQPPLLSFGIEKKVLKTEKPEEQTIINEHSESSLKRNRRKRLDEMSKEELIRYLAEIPSLMPRPVCEFTVDGKKLRGAVEKLKGDYVYIKVAFGKKWLKYTMQQIKDIKVIRI